jgi:hypothetical protein
MAFGLADNLSMFFCCLGKHLFAWHDFENDWNYLWLIFGQADILLFFCTQ